MLKRWLIILALLLNAPTLPLSGQVAVIAVHHLPACDGPCSPIHEAITIPCLDVCYGHIANSIDPRCTPNCAPQNPSAIRPAIQALDSAAEAQKKIAYREPPNINQLNDILKVQRRE